MNCPMIAGFSSDRCMDRKTPGLQVRDHEGREIAMEIEDPRTTGKKEEKSGGYKPIENHGLIGDLHTTALVGMDGSIDWLCLPRFDSPSVFAAILDTRKGGRFKIAPTGGGVTTKQLYWPDTNVLITRFFTPNGVGEITDYMPVKGSDDGHHRSQIVRRVEVVRGTMAFGMECSPAFDYARAEHDTEIVSGGAVFRSPQLSLGLVSVVPLEKRNGEVAAEFTLQEGQSVAFVLRDVGAGADRGVGFFGSEEEALFMQTVDYWRRWLSKSKLHGPLARDGPSFGTHPEAAHLRANRSDSRGSNFKPARRHRWREELGLPLHLDPGLRLHALRLPPDRLHRRGAGFHGLAGIPLPELQSRRFATTNVRYRWALGADRGDPGSPRRLPGLEARPHRQRSLRPAPTRRGLVINSKPRQ